ncbi:hypothetical protein QQS21_012216 [Conoideocrella luteorostrata]|uniref:SRP54-type proteins GTP-binding domain-containing protein n=1 Tax=Conoideocrella luteorostrata TaxID=1105319 RepID=A0AAJ0CBM3_9HYPO|nr:hypothetical protein QQS21_012216 [Conoideocrella luteorostrata]
MTLTFTDDKAPICIPFILKHLQTHQSTSPRCPLIIGLNGMQGIGKTTLVAPLAAALANNNIKTLVFSLDDFYLTHEDQVKLATENADNALVQHRGEPGTHDVNLVKAVFAAIINGHAAKIPRYDKALFSGQGDRLPMVEWESINRPGDEPIQVVIFEGWAVGFRPLCAEEVEAKWKAPSRTLRKHKLEHLLLVNEKLRDYDAITDLFDAFVHIDSEDAEYVYGWRQEQEDSLRISKGDSTAGMTPEQVVKFVDGYYPAYELYTDGMRSGVFKDSTGCQLRMIVGRDRKVKQVIEI